MKKYDISAKTNTYTDKQTGEEKGRYENVGEVHAGKDGGFYARLNVIRLLGVCHMAIAKGQDSILASMFVPREAQSAQPNASAATRKTTENPPDFDDDITF